MFLAHSLQSALREKPESGEDFLLHAAIYEVTYCGPDLTCEPF